MTIKPLLSEAEEIRKEYQRTQDLVTKDKLKRRYSEIDNELTALRKKASPKRRKSIGKKQLETDMVALELLNLCQSITADGTISDDEVAHLRRWLEDSTDSELPAIEFLRDVVELICEDGVVTDEERRQLYGAIETVLPSEHRKFAKQRRKIADSLAKEETKQKSAEQKERQCAEREASRPIHYADFMVAGVAYEGRDRIISKYVRTGIDVFLVRDRSNKFSNFATAIMLSNGQQIGFAPEEEAIEIAPMLDSAYPYTATVKKILTGGRNPIPVIIASIYNPHAPVDGLVVPGEEPISRPKRKRGIFGLRF